MLLRRLVFALSTICLGTAFLMAAFTGGCKTSGLPKPVSIAISGVVDCTEGATRDTALHILDDAASALATGSWQAALLDLATRWGGDALSCAVSKIQQGSYRAYQVHGDEIENTKATRASQWLSEHRVVFADHIDAGAM